MVKREDCVKIGEIGKTHNLQGALVVYTDNDLLEQYMDEPVFILLEGAPVPFYIAEDGLTERNHSSYIVKFDFVDSKEQADRLVGCDLFEGTNHAITIDILKGAMRKFAFDTPGILKLELSGQVILDFLLDHFVPAVLYYDSAYCTDGQAPSKADKKLLAIFSGNYKQDYQNARTGTEPFDLYLRLLMVTDYISGMTDSYARTLYRELSGIE